MGSGAGCSCDAVFPRYRNLRTIEVVKITNTIPRVPHYICYIVYVYITTQNPKPYIIDSSSRLSLLSEP